MKIRKIATRPFFFLSKNFPEGELLDRPPPSAELRKKGGNVPTPAAVPFGELAREKLFFGIHDSFVVERKGEHKEEHEAGSAVRRTIPSEMRRLPK